MLDPQSGQNSFLGLSGYGFHPWCPDGWSGRRAARDKKVCLFGCVSHDMTFDLAIVTLSFKIFSGLYLGNCKV